MKDIYIFTFTKLLVPLKLIMQRDWWDKDEKTSTNPYYIIAVEC